MTPQDIAALRVLLARAKAAGSERLVDKVGPEKDHIWKGGGGYVSLLAGRLHIVPPGEHSDEWLVPARSVAEVTKVLELAGVLPPWPPAARIRAWGDSGSDQMCSRCLMTIAEGDRCAIVGPLPGVVCTYCARLISEGAIWIQRAVR